MTAWWLPDDCLMTAWWLPDDCLIRFNIKYLSNDDAKGNIVSQGERSRACAAKSEISTSHIEIKMYYALDLEVWILEIVMSHLIKLIKNNEYIQRQRKLKCTF